MYDPVLNVGAFRRPRVRYSCEGYHRVERQIGSGQCGFQRVIQFLFRAKCFRRGLISHLDEIANRKIGKRIGILFSAPKVFRECAFAVLRQFVKALIQLVRSPQQRAELGRSGKCYAMANLSWSRLLERYQTQVHG